MKYVPFDSVRALSRNERTQRTRATKREYMRQFRAQQKLGLDPLLTSTTEERDAFAKSLLWSLTPSLQ